MIEWIIIFKIQICSVSNCSGVARFVGALRKALGWWAHRSGALVQSFGGGPIDDWLISWKLPTVMIVLDSILKLYWTWTFGKKFFQEKMMIWYRLQGKMYVQSTYICTMGRDIWDIRSTPMHNGRKYLRSESNNFNQELNNGGRYSLLSQIMVILQLLLSDRGPHADYERFWVYPLTPSSECGSNFSEWLQDFNLWVVSSTEI